MTVTISESVFELLDHPVIEDAQEEELNQWLSQNDALAQMRNLDPELVASRRNNQDVNPQAYVHPSVVKGVNRHRKMDLKMNAFERRN
ncbi:MAG: hypothetical protein WCP93_00790 [Candidatus Berkelbacteria bacterium]